MNFDALYVGMTIEIMNIQYTVFYDIKSNYPAIPLLLNYNNSMRYNNIVFLEKNFRGLFSEWIL